MLLRLECLKTDNDDTASIVAGHGEVDERSAIMAPASPGTRSEAVTFLVLDVYGAARQIK